MKKRVIIFISGMILVTLLMLFMLLFIRHSVADIMSQTDEKTYDSHYVMISGDTSDQWRSIYDAAKTAAQKSDVKLEWLGEELPSYYGTEDCLRIAAANQSDGIILHLSPGEKMTELIDEAANAGIPVITVLKDDPDSSRVSYIGMNSYKIGEIYGKRVLQDLQPGDNHVAVLLNSSLKDSAASLMYSQMMQVVEQGKKPEQKVEFSTYQINTTTGFDAEEDIRDFFRQSESLPDILICLDLTSTECVCQALVDYNEVGNMKVLGYYASDMVKDGIRKGLIEATLLLDTDEIGRLCVEALNEYRQLGHVNNYYNAGMQMITIKTLLRQEYLGK